MSKHPLVIAEAHHVLSRKKEHREGVETVVATFLRQIREYGEAVIVIDQEPSNLSSSITANTYTKITFNLPTGRDTLDASRSMSLTPHQSEYLTLLGIGEALVSSKGRIDTPVYVALPLVVSQKGARQTPSPSRRPTEN